MYVTYENKLFNIYVLMDYQVYKEILKNVIKNKVEFNILN